MKDRCPLCAGMCRSGKVLKWPIFLSPAFSPERRARRGHYHFFFPNKSDARARAHPRFIKYPQLQDTQWAHSLIGPSPVAGRVCSVMCGFEPGPMIAAETCFIGSWRPGLRRGLKETKKEGSCSRVVGGVLGGSEIEALIRFVLIRLL